MSEASLHGGWQFSPSVRTWTRLPEPSALPSWRSVLDALELPTASLREFLAIHEAAHAVAASAHPFYVQEGEPVMRLRWVELAPSAVPRNGQILNAGLCSVSYESGTNWWDVAAQTVAGERATVRWLREEGLWTPLRGWIAEASSAGDRRNIDALDDRFRIAWNRTLREVYAEHGITPVLFEELQERADDLLDWLWPAVRRIARLLQHHGRLTSHQVHSLLGPFLDTAPNN